MGSDSIKRNRNMDFKSDIKSDIKEESLNIEENGINDIHYKIWLQNNGLINSVFNYQKYLKEVEETIKPINTVNGEEAQINIDEKLNSLLSLVNELEKSNRRKNEEEVNKSNNTSTINSTNTFNMNALLCKDFINGLNDCTSDQDLVEYVNYIVDGLSYGDNIPTQLGTGGMFSNNAYINGGIYDGFITPSISIKNDTIGYSYHIYDRNYLYSFAYGLKKLNLSEDANILPYIMKFLDSYFGFPKDNIDRREDVFYNWAVLNAEKFYRDNNIQRNPQFDTAVNQMQMNGDFPLNALKGAYAAKCVERAALAQNIMKLCGFNASIMYGDCESRQKIEGHCWNTINDENGNLYIIDFSNTVYSYENGRFVERKPYANSISHEDIINNNGIIQLLDYHYENGVEIADNQSRRYAMGKSLNLSDKKEAKNKLK